MPLTKMTITGADDLTSVDDLIEISAAFPFVEWGILIGTHHGTERFPSRDWIIQLVEASMHEAEPLNLSLHVCGQHLRDIANGSSQLDDFLSPQLFHFRRVQLNWHGERQQPNCSENILKAFCELDTFGWDPTLIFQLDGVNDLLFDAPSRRFACCGLFDRSHGAGVLPGEWPQCSTDIPCGWAGGLGPDNLAEEIPRITEKSWAALDFWIDMETHVRTGDHLDLDKVRQCLEIAQPFVDVAVG